MRRLPLRGGGGFQGPPEEVEAAARRPGIHDTAVRCLAWQRRDVRPAHRLRLVLLRTAPADGGAGVDANRLVP
eukprot:5782892-Alexandrium_andersonii.AAC.1